MLVKESLPEFSKELTALLHRAGEAGLAEQVRDLKIVDRCRCGDNFCTSFYTAPRPSGAYGAGHRNISLEPNEGMIILDIGDERIMQVEVLYRDDVRFQLASIFP